MQIPIPKAPLNIEYLYEQAKFWCSAVAFMYGGFKALEWVKAIRNTDLKTIHEGVDGLKLEIGQQTVKTVGALDAQTTELRELRQDLRTFYAPPPLALAARARRKKSPKKK